MAVLFPKYIFSKFYSTLQCVPLKQHHSGSLAVIGYMEVQVLDKIAKKTVFPFYTPYRYLEYRQDSWSPSRL